MSLVRITNDLIDEVAAKVSDTSASVFKTSIAPNDPMRVAANVDTLFGVADRQIWAPYATLRSQLPGHWFVRVPRVDVHVIHDGLKLREIQLDRELLAPPDTQSYGFLDINIPSRDVPAELFDALQAYFVSCDDHAEKFKSVSEQLRKFLRSHKSLNAALKAYPDLALYVPPAYIERVNRKDQRPGAVAREEEVQPAIDRDMITSLGVVGALHKKE
jgi:hypothetical protein